jgi:hypothetical protein
MHGRLTQIAVHLQVAAFFVLTVWIPAKASAGSAAIQIDGVLNEPAWKQAPTLRAFSYPWVQRAAPLTEFRAIADQGELGCSAPTFATPLWEMPATIG